MATIRLVRDAPLTPFESWSRLTSWENHAALVPLTSIRITPQGFVARTGFGPIGFDDVMEIVEWRPVELCRLEKRGRYILGWAEISVEPSAKGSLITWVEEIRIRWVPSLFDPLLAAAARLMFGRTMDGLLRTND